MKIKTHTNTAQQGQTIVIQGQREGCFLRTLNCGCVIVALIIFALGVGFFWTISRGSFNKARNEAKARATAPQSSVAPDNSAAPQH